MNYHHLPYLKDPGASTDAPHIVAEQHRQLAEGALHGLGGRQVGHQGTGPDVAPRHQGTAVPEHAQHHAIQK